MARTSTVETKAETKQAIFQYIMRQGPVTRQDIFFDLGISLPTIKAVIEYLLEHQLICESGKVKNTGGRNAVTYSVAETSRYAIGIFLSGHHISAVCVNLKGEIVHSRRIAVLLNLQDDNYLRMIGEMTENVRTEAGVRKEQLLGVGIAVTSLVSRDGENIIFGMSQNFTGINRTTLSKYIPYKTRMYHDSQAAAFAELWLNKDVVSAVYLNLNNIVGSFVILDQQIYTGCNGLAGEVGHMIVHRKNGKKCYCGRCGCLNTVCNTEILEECGEGKLEDFFAKLDRKDPEAVICWDQYLDYLSLAIHNVRVMLDCPVIIGGYLGSHIGTHLGDLHAKIDEMGVFTKSSAEYVLRCRYDIEATSAGAAIQIVDEYMKQID